MGFISIPFTLPRILIAFIAVLNVLTIVDGSQRRNFTFKMCSQRENNTGTVLLEKTVRSQLDCAAACVTQHGCRSAIFTNRGDVKYCTLKPDWNAHLDCNLLTWNSNSTFLNMNDPCQYRGLFGPTRTCGCEPGYTGNYCENPPKDCFFSSSTMTGIHPYGTPEKLHVYCTTQNRIVIFQHVGLGEMVGRNNSWDMFKFTFGNYPTIHWAGNHALHRITNSAHYVMYMMVVAGSPYTATEFYYDNFVVDEEANRYTVRYTGFNRTTGNGDNTIINGAPFATTDNDVNGCATLHNAAYWYMDCSVPSPFNGVYPISGTTEPLLSLLAELIRMD